MSNTADLITIIEERLDFAFCEAEEQYDLTQNRYTEGFADGLESAIHIVEKVFYEWNAVQESLSNVKK